MPTWKLLCLRASAIFPAASLTFIASLSSLHSIENQAVTIDTVVARHGIVIIRDPALSVDTPHGTIVCTIASDSAIDRYLPFLAQEWNLYPEEVVKRSRLTRIVLCTQLSFDGDPRSGFIDYKNLSLYLDVESAMHVPQFMRRVIHHEFFHLIDLKDDGEVYADRDWSALNADSFAYVRGARSALHSSGASLISNDIPGVLNKYSTYGVEEDKAELFSFLIVEAPAVYALAGEDRVVAAKVRQMKRLMLSFSKTMNDEFWDTSRQLDRSAK